MSVVIPEGVRSIERYAFYKCTNLRMVKLPETIEKIGDCAFMCGPFLEEFNYSGSKKIINFCTFGEVEIKGLLPKIDTIYKIMTDAALKNVINPNIWGLLSIATKIEIIINRQGKTLDEAYRRSIGENEINILCERIIAIPSNELTIAQKKCVKYFLELFKKG